MQATEIRHARLGGAGWCMRPLPGWCLWEGDGEGWPAATVTQFCMWHVTQGAGQAMDTGRTRSGRWFCTCGFDGGGCSRGYVAPIHPLFGMGPLM